MTTTKRVLPDDFYKASTFFTLSGAAGAVWLVCLVMANLDPEAEFLTPKLYRFIALGLSEVIAIIMLLRSKRKRRNEHWMFAFFNGLLIFVNASGLNAISSKLSFENVASVQERSAVNNFEEKSTASFLSFAFFKNEIDWWMDDALFEDVKKLKDQNRNFRQELDDNRLAMNLASQKSRAKVDSLVNEIGSIRDSIARNAEYRGDDSTSGGIIICEEEIASLRIAMRELEAERAKILQDHVKEIQKLRQEIVDRDRQIRRLQALLEKCEKNGSGTQTNTGQIKELQQEILVLNRELAALKTKLKQCEKNKRNTNTRNLEIDNNR